MKKVLSLTLALLTVMTLLSGCGLLNSPKIKNADKWKEAFKVEKYIDCTLDAKNYYYDETIKIEFDKDKVVYTDYEGNKQYIIIKDGVANYYEDDEYDHSRTYDIEDEVDYYIGSMFEYFEDIFDKVEYDKKLKAYVGTVQGTRVEISFSKNLVSEIKIYDDKDELYTSYKFTKIGKTSAKIPSKISKLDKEQRKK